MADPLFIELQHVHDCCGPAISFKHFTNVLCVPSYNVRISNDPEVYTLRNQHAPQYISKCVGVVTNISGESVSHFELQISDAKQFL